VTTIATSDDYSNKQQCKGWQQTTIATSNNGNEQQWQQTTMATNDDGRAATMERRQRWQQTTMAMSDNDSNKQQQ
jgi:hypothetical protein